MGKYKIALSAGHGRHTAGKRCMKKLDPKETREWVLNSRIAEKVERKLQNFTGYDVLRVDDPTGEKDVSRKKRADAANRWFANIYIAIHHNAGIKGGNGGGIVVYICNKPSWNECEIQTEMYDALIRETGLKGNRATPKSRANFDEVVLPSMDSVLLELGFMDSAKDTPIILTDEYAEKCADAIVSVLVERGSLRGITAGAPETPKEPEPAHTKVSKAKSKSEKLRGYYKVKSPDGFLNLRTGASTRKEILEAMPSGTTVVCYGYHTGNWLYVATETGKVGFCNKEFLMKF